MNKKTNVVIIGGGPAGSTLGSLIKRYKPKMEVLILEREKFPRDHVGESLLPAVCSVLHEMAVWDKIEAANFPIKIGATYRWGKNPKLWDFEFIPGEKFMDEERPAKFMGQRSRTAFQVDRAVYDKILLDHSKELGCKVREETKVTKIHRDGDKVTGIELADGEMIEADYYVDATGHTGVLRRAMGVEVEQPSNLQNVAFWDYWRNAEWAVNIGVGGTRVQVMSIGWGWLWFIPLGPDRTSIGLVCPADFYKKSSKKPEELYLQALEECPRVSELIKNAKREEDKFETTKDWSFVAERLYGENWYLVGESAGFADPILAAGLTLAHMGARHLAHVIVGIERGKHDAKWLNDFYDENQKKSLGQHIRFADFWYTSDGIFQDLLEHSSEIAKDAGLDLDANQAFQWLGTGGFTHDSPELATLGGFSISAVKQIAQQFTETTADWSIAKNNVFKLNMDGAERIDFPTMFDGRTFVQSTYKRGDKTLPHTGLYQVVTDVLQIETRMPVLLKHFEEISRKIAATVPQASFEEIMDSCVQTLEALVCEGWVDASYKDTMPLLKYETPEETWGIHWNRDDVFDKSKMKSS